MAKWNVHFGVRLTYDVEVEADSYEEAVEKATPELENADYAEMTYADQDVDAWEEKENKVLWKGDKRMNTFEIYFSDLNEDAQKRLLEAVGAETAADMNWDMDICPIAMYDFETEEE